MKSLKNTILERLKLNKDTKIAEYKPIPTKFTDNTIFTQKEIDIMQEYAVQLEVKPIIITNYQFKHNKLKSWRNYVYMYYDDGWDKNTPSNYIYLAKGTYSKTWDANVIINEHNFLVSDSNNIEQTCIKLLIYLDKHPDFYNSVKNN